LAATMVILCAVGAWISGALLKQHAGPWPSSSPALGLFDRLCGTGLEGESGCAAALKSDWSAFDFSAPVITRELTIRWSRIVVPVAFIGMAYFVSLGVWYTFSGSPESWGRGWRFMLLTIVIGGAAGSVVFLWLMFFRLESRCTWCLATHALNGLLLAGTWHLCAGKRRPSTDLPFGESNVVLGRSTLNTLPLRTALRVIGFAASVIIGLWVYWGEKVDIRREVAKLMPYKQIVEKQQSDPAFLLREYYAGPLNPNLGRIADRNAESSVTKPQLVIFSDFQCSHCACFASRWEKEFRPHWQGRALVVFRHFPLCQVCNDTVRGERHPEACRASYAAEAARLQGGVEAFWRMHDALFARRGRLDPELYAVLARKIGLDGEQLLTDMESEAVRQAVTSDIALAAELGVKGTPSVFLNGRPIPRSSLFNPVFWEAVSLATPERPVLAESAKPNVEPRQPPGGRKLAGRGITNP